MVSTHVYSVMVQDYILYGIPEIRSCNFKFYTCKNYKNTSMLTGMSMNVGQFAAYS